MAMIIDQLFVGISFYVNINKFRKKKLNINYKVSDEYEKYFLIPSKIPSIFPSVLKLKTLNLTTLTARRYFQHVYVLCTPVSTLRCRQCIPVYIYDQLRFHDAIIPTYHAYTIINVENLWGDSAIFCEYVLFLDVRILQ